MDNINTPRPTPWHFGNILCVIRTYLVYSYIRVIHTYLARFTRRGGQAHKARRPCTHVAQNVGSRLSLSETKKKKTIVIKRARTL